LGGEATNRLNREKKKFELKKEKKTSPRLGKGEKAGQKKKKGHFFPRAHRTGAFGGSCWGQSPNKTV